MRPTGELPVMGDATSQEIRPHLTRSRSWYFPFYSGLPLSSATAQSSNSKTRLRQLPSERRSYHLICGALLDLAKSWNRTIIVFDSYNACGASRQPFRDN
jgi:hypothetical protein